MKFNYNDGGRQTAGFKGTTSDCVVRAISIATGKPYKEVYDDINKLSDSLHGAWKLVKTKYGNSYVKVSASRTGVLRDVYQKYLENLGWRWVPTNSFGSKTKVHLKEDELPKATIIVKVSKHLTTVINGVLNDTYDCSRNETRMVYGYFIKDDALNGR